MSERLNKIKEFVQKSKLFNTSAQVMADLALRLTGSESSELYLLMLLTVQKLQEQHVCLQLASCSGTVLTAADGSTLQLPTQDEFISALRKEEMAPAVKILSADEENSVPESLLVIDSLGGCYLQRQWSFEFSICRALQQRAQLTEAIPELPENFLHDLVSFFPNAQQHPELDYQQLAVLAALQRKLMVLSGGPGTGKTTVAAAILAAKLLKNPDLKIMLAAPTAKAAARLIESLRENLGALNVDEVVRGRIQALEASTIQRLLGFIPNSHEFRYNFNNLLDCDLLLVDECSMVPQQLMARLLEAIPLQSDLILLGDRYQLSSVEAGSVLADICAAATANLADKELFEVFKKQTSWQAALLTDEERSRRQLSGSLIELKENHRFAKSAKLLGRIAALVRDLQDSDDIDLIAREIANVAGKEFEYERECSDSQLKKMISAKLTRIRLESGESLMQLKNLAASGNEEDRLKAFKLLNSFKILAPGYHDRRGIARLNELCMNALDLQDPLEPGTPLLILKNDYRLGLFNGDIGLVAMDEQSRKRFFVEGNPQSFNLNDLPEYEVVFAMSVHKSQGSGYDEVLFVMPESANALMTREMVYTAMTRAKKELRCIGSVEVLAEALKNPTLRMSNLALRLQKK